MMDKFPVTQDTARRALAHLDASDRDFWVKIGQALKSEFDDDGFTLFDEWSASASNYDSKAVKTTWKGIKSGGRVSIGTLIYEAAQRGFDPKTQAVNADASSMTPEARQAAQQRHDEAQRREADKTAQAQAQARREAVRRLARAQDAGNGADSPYLGIKQVKAYGVKCEATPDGVNLLVPLRDKSGMVWNVQTIKPDGTKLFAKSARVSGLFHLIGGADMGDGIERVPRDKQRADAPDTLLVAEGYATAATLHEATGYAVAVAFNAGNLSKVCTALRGMYLSARLLVCADNDTTTAARTGTNTGVQKARAAAAAVNGTVAVPDGLPEGATDFNDLYRHAGIDAVKMQVEQALNTPVNAPVDSITDHAHDDVPVFDGVPVGADYPDDGDCPVPDYADYGVPDDRLPDGDYPDAAGSTMSQTTPKNAPKNASKGARNERGQFVKHTGGGFDVNDNGVFYHGFTPDGKPKPPQLICSPLRITANTRDDAGNDWGYLLEFNDPLDNPKRWAMPAHMLAGSGEGMRGRLLNMGLRIEASHEARHALSRYIQNTVVDAFARCTERVGWCGDAFVFPERIIGDIGDELLVYQTEAGGTSPFAANGTLEQWREHIAMKCVDNSRPMFALCCAFAGVLLQPTGIQSGGFHFVGDSSIGKSTLLYLASSVWGARNYVQTWNNTATALESVAAAHSDTLLTLDEIGQVPDPRTIGEIVYGLGNEKGKGRGLRASAGVRPVLTWRLLYLSSGEKRLHDVMREVGKQERAGQDIRLINIEALSEAHEGKGGIYDAIDNATDGAALSRHFKQASDTYHGTAGVAFIEYIQPQLESLRDTLKKRIAALVREWTPHGAHGQVERVAERFAFVAVAGELASEAGITGWRKGEAETAVKICFDEWLEARGGVGNAEDNMMLAQVQGWFEVNADARLKPWQRAHDDHAPSIGNMAGYKRIYKDGMAVNDGRERWDTAGDDTYKTADCETKYYVYSEVFKNELSKGFNYRTVINLLLARGIIEPDNKGKSTQSVRLPLSKNKTRLYVFNQGVLSCTSESD